MCCQSQVTSSLVVYHLHFFLLSSSSSLAAARVGAELHSLITRHTFYEHFRYFSFDFIVFSCCTVVVVFSSSSSGFNFFFSIIFWFSDTHSHTYAGARTCHLIVAVCDAFTLYRVYSGVVDDIQLIQLFLFFSRLLISIQDVSKTHQSTNNKSEKKFISFFEFFIVVISEPRHAHTIYFTLFLLLFLSGSLARCARSPKNDVSLCVACVWTGKYACVKWCPMNDFYRWDFTIESAHGFFPLHTTLCCRIFFFVSSPPSFSFM